MVILVAGLSHHTAPVSVRERFSQPDRRAALSDPINLRTSALSAGCSEAAVLSTCNRTELYVAAADPESDAGSPTGDPAQLLADAGGMPVAALAPYLYHHAGPMAVRHLCRVAAGLDSMVLGESEVIGQVGAALGTGLESGTIGPILEAAFHAALRAGRRARTETGISRGSASVASEAARLVRGRLPAIEQSAVLIIGTGAMGRAVAAALRGARPRSLAVIGRTPERTRRIATELDITGVMWDGLGDALQKADAVVTATMAPAPIVTRAMVEHAHAGRSPNRRSVFVDLALPRNVEATVRDIPSVELYDLDQLQILTRTHLEGRQAEISLVEVIVDEEVAAFETWRRGATLRPILGALHLRGEQIRRTELERQLQRAGVVSPEVREMFEAFSRRLVRQLLHEPSHRLRAETDPKRSHAYAQAMRELLGAAPSDEWADDDGTLH